MEDDAGSSKESIGPGTPRMLAIPRNLVALAGAGLLLIVLAVYSNHFENGFHFDDSHSVETNPYIRSLANIPRFFTDAHTPSSLLPNQSYRPLVTASLAFDYHMASSGATVGTYTVGSVPIGVASDGTNIWVANSGSNTVTKIAATH